MISGWWLLLVVPVCLVVGGAVLFLVIEWAFENDSSWWPR